MPFLLGFKGLSYYVFDYDFGELLTVTVLAAIALAALLLENDYLVTFHEGILNLANNFSALYGGCAYLHIAVNVGEEYVVELQGVAFLDAFDVLDIQETVLLGLELLSFDFYDNVHLNAVFKYVSPRGGRSSASLCRPAAAR